MGDELTWEISCRPDIFDQCRGREGFSELVCVARCINALNFVYSPVSRLDGKEPHHIRDRMNFYFFNAAILYEGLALVRQMSSVFKRDAAFQETLRPLLKDNAAQKIRSLHLKKIRNNAVFHFDAGAFLEVLQDLPTHTCVFLKANSTVDKDVHFEFADRMAVRILVGDTEREDFRNRLNVALEEIRNFSGRFATEATAFLAKKLPEWGFDRKESKGTAAEN